jgi:Tat protein secretion system quality control protein TatD with DNase activity
VKLISFAKKLNLPIVIHSRDAYEETINILEQERSRKLKMVNDRAASIRVKVPYKSDDQAFR